MSDHTASWFDTARFGMFIHWGHSSQRGIELSWPLVGGAFGPPMSRDLSVADYHATAATFDPKAWDAAALAARAKVLGMQYAVFTTRHHDGYSMFHSQHSDFSIAQSPYGRDIVREYADAFRAAGVRVGFYYSLSDWHHPDYPAFREEDKPYGVDRIPQQPDEAAWQRYLDYMFGQVRELMTNYGEISVLWFDGQWERRRREWKADELAAMVRELQPGIVINDRLPGQGDYATPEQFVPAQAPAGPWETCMTINESWGFNPEDTRYKSSRTLVHTLCEVASKGGNLLLNVGPRGDGAVPTEIETRLDDVAGWMARHRDSIIGTTPGLEPWQFYGPSTRRGNTVYAHLLMRPYDSVTIRGVRAKRLQSARAMGTGADLRRHMRVSVVDTMFNTPDPLGEITIDVPAATIDDFATVIALEFEGDPVA
jgi:alpha-L-fucosidase